MPPACSSSSKAGMRTITSSARPPWKIIGTSVRRGATAIWPPAFSTCAALAILTTNWSNECAPRCRDKSPAPPGRRLLAMATKRRMLRLFLKLGLGVVGLIVLLVGGLVAYVGFKKRQFTEMPDTHDLLERIEKLAGSYLGARTNGGLVIGVIQQSQRFVKGYGRVSEANAAPPDAATLFEIGSVTKVFTAVTLAGMVLDGKVKLEDPITFYLPKEVTNRGLAPITLRHLATHTSGLPRLPENFDAVSKDEADPYADYRAADLYRCLNALPPRKTRAKKPDYSNLGFGLLGHILELAAGKPYEQLVQETICLPLGMSNTAIRLSEEQKKRLSPGHDAQ